MTDSPTPSPAAVPHRAKPGSDRTLTIGALVLAAGAMTLAGWGQLTFGDRVRSYLLANPAVLDEVIQAREATRYSDLFATINAAAEANPQLLAHDPRDPALGPEAARVVVHQFFDYRCPYCKLVAEPWLALAEAHPDVRFVFKEWPILDGPQEGPSHLAARAALAAQAQGRYVPVHQALMAADSLDTATIQRILTQNGVDLSAAGQTMETAGLRGHIQAVESQAAALGLQGTPTFFVAGRVVESNDPAELNRLIEAAKAAH